MMSAGATIFEEALLPRNSDRTVLFGTKAYYGDLFPSFDMKVTFLGGMTKWESIINAPDE